MGSLERLEELDAVARLRARDVSLFSDDIDLRIPIMQRLGWTDLAEKAPGASAAARRTRRSARVRGRGRPAAARHGRLVARTARDGAHHRRGRRLPEAARARHHLSGSDHRAARNARPGAHLRAHREQVGLDDRAALALRDRARVAHRRGHEPPRGGPALHRHHRPGLSAREAARARAHAHGAHGPGHCRRPLLGAVACSGSHPPRSSASTCRPSSAARRRWSARAPRRVAENPAALLASWIADSLGGRRGQAHARDLASASGRSACGSSSSWPSRSARTARASSR